MKAKNIRTIKDLLPDPNNANKGTERGGNLLENSLREFGAGRSILVDRNGLVIAGNKTLEKAAEVGLTDIEVIRTDGNKLVAVQRTDLDLETDDRAKKLAIADNRVGELNLNWNPAILASMKVDLSQFFTEKEIEGLEYSSVKSDGSMLAKLNVTIEDPHTEVKPGDIWKLGPHTLCCVSVVADWQQWTVYLKDKTLFCPFPGPLVVVSERAKKFKLVMVQPDTYIAGHIVDRFIELNGDKEVRK